jgi:hypothetical protein
LLDFGAQSWNAAASLAARRCGPGRRQGGPPLKRGVPVQQLPTPFPEFHATLAIEHGCQAEQPHRKKGHGHGRASPTGIGFDLLRHAFTPPIRARRAAA